jgi:hypothetical protein
MPVQRVLDAVLLQYAMGCGLFAVGHDCTSFPSVGFRCNFLHVWHCW